MPRIILEFADQGWHVRWRTPDTAEFEATREAFKDILSIRDRYWDPDAFEGRGGWWVAYGALGQVGHLFENYQEARDALEREHWQRYEQQLREARERFAHEQERGPREEFARQQQQERAERERRRREQADEERRRADEQQRKTPKREEVKLPKTLEEALAVLHLSPPITASAIRRAYRAQALKCHPDRGGSHAAMVEINAAYEIALAACAA
jgi:flagellar biosynthesis GTPase FlhF